MRLVNLEITSSTTWVCPAGITSIIVLGQGGGGGGGMGSETGGSRLNNGGQGGLATFLVPRIINVVPNTTYTITIGAGGTGMAISPETGFGGDGGDTIFGSLATFKGAKGGAGAFYASGLLGGILSQSTGYVMAIPTPITTTSIPYTNPETAFGTYPSGSPTSLGNSGTFSYTTGGYGTTSSTGGAGSPGSSSDAGLGGRGGDGGTTGSINTNASNAPTLSYGAGGGGGGSRSSTGHGSAGTGGNGAGGRMIIIWAE